MSNDILDKGKPFTGRLIAEQQAEGRREEYRIINGFFEQAGAKAIENISRVFEKLRKE